MALLRVRAYLSSPVALRDPLHLDGLAVACAEGVSGRHITRTCPADQIVRPPIPIASLTVAGHEVYLCSAAEPAPDAKRASEHLTRRRDGADLDYLTRRVDTRTGPGRDVMLRFPVWLTPYLEWWCVGNRRGLRKLLPRRTQSVGMLRRQGYGMVSRWEFERVDGVDTASVLVLSGRARRNLPAAWCDAPEVVERVPVSAPYWHPATVVDGVMTGRHTGLTAEAMSRVGAAR